MCVRGDDWRVYERCSSRAGNPKARWDSIDLEKEEEERRKKKWKVGGGRGGSGGGGGGG